jgi:hypothetical protein
MSGGLRYTEATLVRPWTVKPTTWYAGYELPVGTAVLVEWMPGRPRARVYERCRWGAGRRLFSVALDAAHKYVRSDRR